jgi:hypothetical protein
LPLKLEELIKSNLEDGFRVATPLPGDVVRSIDNVGAESVSAKKWLTASVTAAAS